VAVRLTKLAGPRPLTLIASWVFPASAVGMLLAPSLWVIAVMGGAIGFAIMPANVIFTSRSTQITPDHLQAQTANAMTLCYTSLSTFTPALFGALTDQIGPYWVITIAAVIYTVTALWLQFSRHLYQLDDPYQPGDPPTGRQTS
jgi:MFS family permease